MNPRRHASHRGPSLWLWLALALLVLVLDQLTKWLIVGQFVLGDSRPITSFFNLVRAHNPGRHSRSWHRRVAGSAGCSPGLAWLLLP